jgi:hypothetical protein
MRRVISPSRQRLRSATVARSFQVEMGLDARHDDCRPDRFGDVVHRAEGQTVLLLVGLFESADEDDRDVCRGGVLDSRRRITS